MALSTQTTYWAVWLLASIALGFWLGNAMLDDEADQTVLMPGELSPGHHQLAEKCEACHTDAFGGGEVIQQTCVDCHGMDRVKPFDSHPAKKFKDPRNADLLASINALQCISCHTEHKPEITAKDGVTQPVDVCFHCHQEIADERPSHQGMGFDTCKDSGCHNFHNNRALYTDFLIKHLDQAAMLDQQTLPAKEFVSVLEEIIEYPRDKYPLKRLDEKDIDAADKLGANPDIKMEWLETAHARSGVNCSACHQHSETDAKPAEWHDHPDHRVCESCHNSEVSRFLAGKHGMRLQQGLSPMTPDQALLPMKADAAHVELTCTTCHGSHRFDVQQAAVEACLGCHDDSHSLAYKASPHYRLWQNELAGEAEPGTGVSCASCHMPRVNRDVSEWLSRIVVDHNQSANLSPNSKMVRSSCQHCHGLEFTLSALANDALIESNFNGMPSEHTQSMKLAEKENIRRQQEASDDDDTDMFGF
ncbi:MAG: NrfA- nitrite reduction protein [Gammaproteobacteria bacterium]|nr:NrfA- nitrite reduction protein [Gammaproteobacteria bacterium]